MKMCFTCSVICSQMKNLHEDQRQRELENDVNQRHNVTPNHNHHFNAKKPAPRIKHETFSCRSDAYIGGRSRGARKRELKVKMDPLSSMEKKAGPFVQHNWGPGSTNSLNVLLTCFQSGSHSSTDCYDCGRCHE